MTKKITEKQIGDLDFSRFTDAEIIEHFNGRCQICGSTWECALHHMVFKSQMGHNGPRVPLCNRCHMRLHGEAGFRKKHESKLFRIAHTFYVLQSQGVLF